MLREAGQGEPRLHVPATVYNAILNRPEPVLDEDRKHLPAGV